MSYPTYWTKDRITLAIRAHHHQHGTAPMARDWKRGTPDHPSSETVYRNFPNWAAAIRAAGLEPHQRGPTIWTRDAVLAAFHRWAAEHGRQPGQDDWYRGTPHHPAYPTVRRLFGSWNKGVEAAGFTPRPAHHQPVRRWTRDETIAACQAWYRRHGRPPRQLDWRPGTDGYPSDTVVCRLFGRWSRMIRASNLGGVHVPTTMPSAVVAEIVRPHLRRETEEQIAGRSGVTTRTLYAILSGERPTVGKRTVDKLLVAIDRPDAWHVELAEYAA